MNRLGTAVLVALGLALAVGMATRATGVPAGLQATLQWFVQGWTQTLALVAVPLVVAQLFLAVVGSSRAGSSGQRAAIATPFVMAGLLVLAATVTLVSMTLLLQLPWLDALRLGDPSGPSGAGPGWAQPDLTGNWLDDLLPQAIVTRALSGDLLALLVVTVAVAVMARWIDQERRDVLVGLAEAVSALAFASVKALLFAAPAIVFATLLGAFHTSGIDVGTVLVANAVLKVVVTLAVIATLYGVIIATGVPVGRFSRAAFPGQIVALATRSSLASLPALMAGARDRLGLDAHLSGGLLGLAGAALKLSGPVSSTFKFLFLAHVLGIGLSPVQIGAFVLTVLATSATTVGIPRMVSESSALAFYAAAGMPLEYVVLLSTTTVLTDPVSTLLNSTAYMTFATVVCRVATTDDPSPSPQAISAPGTAN